MLLLKLQKLNANGVLVTDHDFEVPLSDKAFKKMIEQLVKGTKREGMYSHEQQGEVQTIRQVLDLYKQTQDTDEQANVHVAKPSKKRKGKTQTGAEGGVSKEVFPDSALLGMENMENEY